MRRAFFSGIGAAILACALACSGCGGSLHDAPDLTKGPSLGEAKLKKMEEWKAKKAAAAQAKGAMKRRAAR
jgi:hypothetical protein